MLEPLLHAPVWCGPRGRSWSAVLESHNFGESFWAKWARREIKGGEAGGKGGEAGAEEKEPRSKSVD